MSFVSPQQLRIAERRPAVSTKTTPVCRKPLKHRNRKTGPKQISTRPQTQLPPLPGVPQRHLKLARAPIDVKDYPSISKVTTPLKERRDLRLETSCYHEPGALGTVINVRDRRDHTLIIATTKDTALIAAHEVRMCESSKGLKKPTPVIVAAGNKVPGGWQHPAINANSKKYPVIVIASIQGCLHQFLLNNHGREYLKKVKFLVIVDATGVVEMGMEKMLSRILKATNAKESRKNVVMVRDTSQKHKKQVEKLSALVLRDKTEEVKWDELWKEEHKEAHKSQREAEKKKFKLVGKTFSETLQLRLSSDENEKKDQFGEEEDKSSTIFKNFSNDIFLSLDSFVKEGEERRERRLRTIDPEETTFNILSIPEYITDDPIDSSVFSISKYSIPDDDESEKFIESSELSTDSITISRTSQVQGTSKRTKPDRTKRHVSSKKENNSLYLKRLETLSGSSGVEDIFGVNESDQLSVEQTLVDKANCGNTAVVLEDTDEAHSSESSLQRNDPISETPEEGLSEDEVLYNDDDNNDIPLSSNVKQEIVLGDWGNCYKQLKKLMSENRTNEKDENRVMVIFPTGRLVDCYSTMARADGYDVYDVHRRSTASKRERIFDWFNETKSGIMFCTDLVTLKGVSLPSVNRLIQFGAPLRAQEYYTRLNLVDEACGDSFLISGETEVKKMMDKLSISHVEKRNIDSEYVDEAGSIWNKDELDMKAKSRAYTSWISYWKLRRSVSGWTNAQVVDFVNEWALQTFNELPKVPSNIAKRLNIRNLQNVNVEFVPPPAARPRANKTKQKKLRKKLMNRPHGKSTQELAGKVQEKQPEGEKTKGLTGKELLDASKVTGNPWS